MTIEIKKTTGESLATRPVVESSIETSNEIIPDNNITCKGGNLTLHVGGVDYSVLVEYKKFIDSKEAYFNATDTINQYNLKSSLYANSHNKKKLLSNWLRNQDTQELIKKLESLIPPRTHNRTLVEQRGAGRYKSTWLHRELWLHLMYWLDVDHKIAIMQFVEVVMAQHELVTQNREMLKQDTKIKNDAVRVLEEKIKLEHPTSKTAQFIYPNIQRGINRAITGIWSKIDRNKLTSEQLMAIDDLELEVERIIIAHIDTTDALEINEMVKSFLNRQVRWSA